MTVSRVVNSSGYVKTETRDRVLAAMKELNYVPNDLARGLVRQKTNTLALIVPDITNPFYTTVVRGAEDSTREHASRLVLCNSDESLEKEREYIEMCVSIRVDGVLIVPAGDGSKSNLQLLDRFGIPYVLLDREVDGVSADVVKGNSLQGAYNLTQLLIGLGHRHIAMISGLSSTSTGRERLQGYKHALAEASIPFSGDYIEEVSYLRSLSPEVVKRLMWLKPRPTAIFAANNWLAVQSVQFLQELGYKVPKDTAIVCFDDVEAFSVVTPFFTVAMQPAYDFGALGVNLLVERARGLVGRRGSKTRKITLDPEIVIRQSSGKHI